MDNDLDKLNNEELKSNAEIDLDDIALSHEEENMQDVAVVEHQMIDDNKDDDAKDDKKGKKKGKQRNYWPLKITIITFCLSIFFSFLSEIAMSKSNIVVALIILVILICISIIFDGIGVSVTSCDLKPFNAMAARKVPHAKVAIMLVKNASKVNNICADVIGDICGIVSGACGASLVATILDMAEGANEFWLAIFVSAFIAAFTVGGKAFEKTISIKNSQQIVMMAARVIGIFYHPEKKRKNNVRKDK